MSFVQEFVTLFNNMPVAAIVCLLLGIVCIIIEIFKQGFGIFGVLGAIFTIVGIVLRVLVKDGNIIVQILIIIFIDALLVGLSFVTMYLLARYGFLKRTPFVQNDTAVGIIRSEGTADNSGLIGKTGVAITKLHPLGKAVFDGKIYDVLADGTFIDKDEKIIVISVEGSKINVKETQNNK